MFTCARPDCPTAAKSSCSVCNREHYCSSSCQKLDWRVHKSICPILKKLSNEFQPYPEVVHIILHILVSSEGNNMRILEHLMLYAKHQFGKEIAGLSYRERVSGERIFNWKVDLIVMHEILRKLSDCISSDNLLSSTSRDTLRYHYVKKSFTLLNRWIIHNDSHTGNGKDMLNEEQLNFLLLALTQVEQNMAAIIMNGREFDMAEGHCQRCLAYANRLRFEGEEKTTSIFIALKCYCALRENQEDYSAALPFAEEAYNLVVEAYDCVHSQVQEAAGVLINILIRKGDYYDAERYAQVTYSNLRDKKNKIDQKSEAVATGAYNLAKVILKQNGDLIKAEELARESISIRTLIHGISHHEVGFSNLLLAIILLLQDKLGDETKTLFELNLQDTFRNFGPDGTNTAVANAKMGAYYYEVALVQTTVDSLQAQLLLAISHLEEATRIRMKVYGPTHQDTVNVSSRLADVIKDLNDSHSIHFELGKFMHLRN